MLRNWGGSPGVANSTHGADRRKSLIFVLRLPGRPGESNCAIGTISMYIASNSKGHIAHLTKVRNVDAFGENLGKLAFANTLARCSNMILNRPALSINLDSHKRHTGYMGCVWLGVGGCG